jgi:hypothetical protein
MDMEHRIILEAAVEALISGDFDLSIEDLFHRVECLAQKRRTPSMDWKDFRDGLRDLFGSDPIHSCSGTVWLPDFLTLTGARGEGLAVGA